MQLQDRLFRKVSLERLSSPEQLDQLMQVTTPRGWIALIALSGLIITAVFWGIFGSIPTKVMGRGILTKTGGVFNIVAGSGGEVTDVGIVVGDVVEEGQVIARIGQPQLTNQLKEARTKLAEIKTQRDHIFVYGTKQYALQMEYLNKQSQNLKIANNTAQERLKFLEERIANQTQLLKQGLITKQTLLATEDQYNSTQREIATARNQLKQISAKKVELEKQKEQELSNTRQEIDEAKRRIILLQDQLESTSKVTSRYTGRILEVMVNEGDIIGRDSPISSLELIGKAIKELEVVMYVPTAEGKKIRPGMDVQISPSTVRREEYGSMLGKVTSVAEYPSTFQGMMRFLANQKLVQDLSGGGAPIEVHADLIPDSRTLSNYEWSSPKGPPTRIYSGTLCNGSIIVSRQRPISLVIPLLKKKVGM